MNERIDEFIQVIQDVISSDQKGIIVSKLRKGKQKDLAQGFKKVLRKGSSLGDEGLDPN